MHDIVGKWGQACARSCRRALWGAMVLGILAITACQGNGGTKEVSETPAVGSATAVPARETGLAVNRITFVNATGELFTIGADGNDLRPLTGGIQAAVGSTGSVLAQPLNLKNYYAWPTWSPSATKIAASHVRVSGNEKQISMEIIDAENARTQTVYNNQVPLEIARGAPHYLYWSPDSRYLAFLAVVPQGQTLFVLDTSGEGETAALAVGAPIYFHWATDSGSLLIHDEREINLARKPFNEVPQHLVTTMGDFGDFRAPALSPDSQLFAYIHTTEAGASLLVAPVSDPERGRNILEVGPHAAFAWSPNGQELAIADQLDPDNAIFQRLRVVSEDGEQVRTVGEDPIIAFYWSPQGDKIAWVVLDIESRSFDWKVSSSLGGPVKQLFRFQPSSNVFTMLSFFDQYAYSHSPWSPDGTRLVVAGTSEETVGRSNGTTPTEDRVFVLDATGAEAPHSIAPGILAFWSWN